MDRRLRPATLTLAMTFVMLGLCPAVAAAQAQPVALCSPQVDLDWQDLAFDPDDTDATRPNWFVGTVVTRSAGTGCAGVPQTLTLLDDAGTVVFEATTILDDAGDGRYGDAGVRAEDIWNVQVLLHAPGSAIPPGPVLDDDDVDDGPVLGDDGDTGREPAAPRVAVPGEPGTAIAPGSLPRTGMDSSVAILLGCGLIALGIALRRWRTT